MLNLDFFNLPIHAIVAIIKYLLHFDKALHETFVTRLFMLIDFFINPWD